MCSFRRVALLARTAAHSLAHPSATWPTSRLLVQATALDTGQPGTNRSPIHVLCAGCTQVLTVVK